MTRLYTGSANDVYPRLVRDIMDEGQRVGVRGTQTKELTPVVIDLDRPTERLVTSYGRPLNVTFALAEVLWILLGRRDVEMLEFYNGSIKEWSDQGKFFNAPYGYRLRTAHGFDQFRDVELTLSDDKASRRATLCVWHPNDRGWYTDPELTSIVEKRLTKDRACNVLAHLMIRDDKLNWMQVIRSNDVILGVPYNFFQWTSIQEWMAHRLGVGVGTFTYIADSMHLYEDTYYTEVPNLAPFDLYEHYEAPPPMLGWSMEELEQVEKTETALRTHTPDHEAPLLNGLWGLFANLIMAHRNYKAHENIKCLQYLGYCGLYGLAQAKFYWHMRWKKKDDDRAILDAIEDRWGQIAFVWTTEMEHVYEG